PARIGYMLADSGARVVVSDAGSQASLAQFGVETLTVGELGGPREPGLTPIDRSTPDATAYVIYTSGSTGRPKGVEVGHRALLNFLWTMGRRPGFDGRDSLLAVTTVCFDIAGLELYLPLVRGGQVEILPAEVAADGLALRTRLEAAAPTVMQATPTTWRVWLGLDRVRAGRPGRD
ncbi:AMP-binding protein, partial [Enhygromyxa salina]|uniref:AMP-binding protein n=1 Tax=Enhygromyxa salina TaxID=215803 RepID=UPI0011BA4806